MEPNYSFKKQLRKELTARAEMNKCTRMLEADLDKNNEKIYEITREINRIQTVILKRRWKNREHRELSLILSGLKNLKTYIRNKIDTLKQIILHIKDKKDLVKLNIKE